MTMLEKQKLKEAARQRMEFPPPKRRNAWVTYGAVLVIAAALAIAIALTVGGGSSDEPAPVAEVGPVATLYTAEENALMAAVAGGFVPTEAIETELFRTKQLVNQGYLPASILPPDVRPLYSAGERRFLAAAAASETAALVPSIYTAEERALRAAVANGMAPPAVLETDLLKTKALVNQGLIPPAALESDLLRTSETNLQKKSG